MGWLFDRGQQGDVKLRLSRTALNEDGTRGDLGRRTGEMRCLSKARRISDYERMKLVRMGGTCRDEQCAEGGEANRGRGRRGACGALLGNGDQMGEMRPCGRMATLLIFRCVWPTTLLQEEGLRSLQEVRN